MSLRTPCGRPSSNARISTRSRAHPPFRSSKRNAGDKPPPYVRTATSAGVATRATAHEAHNLENPVRAALVERWDQYPFSGAPALPRLKHESDRQATPPRPNHKIGGGCHPPPPAKGP